MTCGDWAAFEALWTPDGIWEESAPVDARIIGGGATIRATLAPSIDRVDFLVQMCHGVTIDTLADGHARARTTIQGLARVGEHSFVNHGIYFDELVKSAGVWRYAHRRLQNVYVDSTPLPGEPATTRSALRESVEAEPPARAQRHRTDRASEVAGWMDKQAIHELTVHYSDAASRGAWSEFEQTWAPDACWEVAPPVDSRVEGRRAIVDSVIANLEGEDFLVQMTHGTVVTLHGADRASSRTTIHAIARQTGAHAVTNYAVYCDDVVKSDGIWQFSRRRLQNVYYDPRPLHGIAPITRADLAELHT